MGTNPTTEKPVVAFILSLISGILVLGGSAMMLSFAGAPYAPYYGYGGMMGGYYGMMGGYSGMMMGLGLAGTWFYTLAVIGTISGIMILAGAILLYSQPIKAPSWGVLILAFSIVSFFGMGGFFLGAILGVVGGVLVLTYRPA